MTETNTDDILKEEKEGNWTITTKKDSNGLKYVEIALSPVIPEKEADSMLKSEESVSDRVNRLQRMTENSTIREIFEILIDKLTNLQEISTTSLLKRKSTALLEDVEKSYVYYLYYFL